MSKLNSDERGIFSYAFVFLIMVVMGIIVFAVIAPMLANMATTTYVVMQPIQKDTQAKVNQITDSNMRSNINAVLSTNQQFQQDQITLWVTLSTFGAVITIILVAIVMTLIARQNVESGLIQ